ncbi:MAG: long-chain fatty acid--CoA ligase [Acidobacteria bacterium]|nr:long-chain fatty acid--CoA ligase [Acidobacteriota bacterium]
MLQTVNDILALAVRRDLPRMVAHRREGGWVFISCADFHRSVAGVAAALSSWGIRKGDRAVILAENRPEWAIADFACLGLGIADVPIYPTLTAEQAAYMLRDSGARVAFVSSAAQLHKVQSVRQQTKVEKIVMMDGRAADAIAMEELMQAGAGEIRMLESAAAAIGPGDLATIIYTSGTTGTPKGAMLTHGNLASNVEFSLRKFELSGSDRTISFLPLSHITARHVDYAMYFHGVPISYSSIEHLPEALREVRPTFIAAVPRIYEKARQTAELAAARGARRRLFDWAIARGRAHRAEVEAGQRPGSLSWRIADRLVFSKIKAGFGGALLAPISGGAPLGRDLAEWFAAIGMRIYEGYGLTETSPVVAVNSPGAFRLGTVGKPLANIECRIAEDGELLVRGPSVFHGYWNLPRETEAALQADGWFHTGDIGAMDGDGFLSITDRKKDLIKTSGGKFIAPQPIENALKANPLIAHACVIGDRRKFPTVVIAPNFGPLEAWASERGMAHAGRGELIAEPAVQGLYQGIVDRLNDSLAQFEKLKKVLIVPDEFSIAGGEITPTLKLRRRVVEERYRDNIEGLYR